VSAASKIGTVLQRPANCILAPYFGFCQACGECSAQIAEVKESSFDVTRHGQIECASDVVPFYGETTVACGIPVFADGECSHEIHFIIVVCVLDGKIMHDKGKGNGLSVVAPQAGSDGTGCISMGF